MEKLSVAIITFNEENNIERCLNSVIDVADEVLVVDSYSTDRTKEICLSKGVTFIENPFEGHIQQKNFALTNATNSLVLSLDADEALTPELVNSIQEIKKSRTASGYKMNRLTNYCGHWVRYCGWYPDTKVRLVHKQHAKWKGVNPHDRLDLINGSKPQFIEGDILHYSYNSIEDHYKQIEYFGKIAATELNKKGKKSNWILIISKVIAQFIKSLFIKKGFLDGKTGFTISRLSAYATYRKYKMLLDFNKQN